MIAVVDYGMGNRRSVEKALQHVGAVVRVSDDLTVLRSAAGLVVPGVGAFPRAMENLRLRGLDELIRERVASGVPTLGLCLGMQLAFERSSELGGAEGLGIVPGVVRALTPGAGLKLPHIGWNEVTWTAPSPMHEGLPDACAFYHVHSFACEPEQPALGVVEYGERFASAVVQDNFWGVQFHPEKSSVHGLRLLANFAAICAHHQ